MKIECFPEINTQHSTRQPVQLTERGSVQDLQLARQLAELQACSWHREKRRQWDEPRLQRSAPGPDPSEPAWQAEPLPAGQAVPPRTMFTLKK